MRRASGLFLFGLVATWGAVGLAVGPGLQGDGPARGLDAGLRLDDGGLRDAGWRDAGWRDAGSQVDGGGVVDAGLDAGLAVDAGPRASWQAFTTTLFDGGVSDLVDLAVGASVDVNFPQPTIETICDDVTLLRLEPQAQGWRFVGVKPGKTHCGFWFSPRPFPHRYVELTVTP